ncbi:MAG: hypothetical protein QNK37_10510 [Acidobacteriota bacterium]|nr:hypothetical protein [Acidobacteriota bacterium]
MKIVIAPAAVALLSFALLTGGVRHPSQQEEAGVSEDYALGRKALKDRRWEDASAHFDKVLENDGKEGAGALYWKAYAQNKLNMQAEAMLTLKKLESRYPETGWARDGRELAEEIGMAAGREPDLEDETKMAALTGLLHMPPEEGLPIAKKILAGKSSQDLKEGTLFVLSQMRTPEAREIVTSIARGERYPALREKGIQLLGFQGGREAGQALDEIYETGDDGVKEMVVNAWATGRQLDKLEHVAKEGSGEVREKAMRALGVMGGSEKLTAMYRAEEDAEKRLAILQAMLPNRQAADFFKEVYRTGTPEEKAMAIRNLGIVGECETLNGIYESAETVKQKAVIIEAMMPSGCALLKEIMETETNDRLRAEALKAYAFSRKIGKNEIVAVYENDPSKEVREVALQCLFTGGAAKELIAIARKETNEDLRLKAVRFLSLMRNDEARAYMKEILEEP